MIYEVRYDEFALKQLKKMDRATRELIISYIEKNLVGTENPRLKGKPLLGNLAGLWRYRVENYRIIVEINDNEITIFILEVEHRSKIYKKN
ncbi:type II toxin-antitoxin system RelE/ParE family toxin [Fusobacterium simiae]|uniref:Type II toxin-antitoxin system RelE/ParE family toxin n=1 Tax=Fusobacterium simiae TaxID=855 RepID=A0ABT4DL31_FUSSI|nr:MULTISPECIES: type II toxin-antitoxin system RelE/ParE family toxin [Fusobacterium]MCY7009149.1 type II toxin-antitoxin system RelE/ParE family toxin [Fusobacterium simiae]MDC7956097.1 type II toxin-antitoxin system RelE/ParE family toxin [Fusobacterium simiae]